jgi:hypothetical protein
LIRDVIPLSHSCYRQLHWEHKKRPS